MMQAVLFFCVCEELENDDKMKRKSLFCHKCVLSYVIIDVRTITERSCGMPNINEDILSEDSIGMLYRLYEQPMYFEAYRILHDQYLAEDALHEAFLRLIRNRSKIADPNSPAVRSYVRKTVRSAALDLCREQKKQREKCLELDEAIENTVTAEEPIADLSLSLLAQLPPKYASVMRCLFFDGLSVRETSAVMKISESLVRKRCERARKLLKSASVRIEKETYNGR